MQSKRHKPKSKSKSKSKAPARVVYIRHADGSYTQHTEAEAEVVHRQTVAAQREQEFRSHWAERHLGLIKQRAFYWHRKLPTAARFSYDVEDMISDITVYISTKVKMYSALRAKESTWLRKVIDNHCRTILQYFYRHKRNAQVTDIASPEIARTLGHKGFLAEREAVSNFQRFVQFCPDNVRDTMDFILTQQHGCSQIHQLPPRIRRNIAALREYASMYNLTADHMIMLYRQYVQ